MDERPPRGRYRGRRRVPAAPRSRYAAVITTAVVGAGVVAMGAGHAFPDAKQNPDQLSTLGNLDAALAERTEVTDRASRADRESGGLATSITQTAPDVWLLPAHDYSFSSPYGMRWGRMHAGVDMAGNFASPIYAAHAGTVTHARYAGGYGNLVIIEHADGVETLYGHQSELLVYEGQEVAAGEVVGLMGNTGYSFGTHLHFEVHVNGTAVDPVVWMEERGVDILDEVEEIYAEAG